MADLAQIFAGLVRHEVAAGGLPAPRPGIAWVVAANGLFKRGVSGDLDILIHVADYVEAWPGNRLVSLPGLVALTPHVRWACWPGRIGHALLPPLLHSAQRAGAGGSVLRPVEKQFFIVAGRGGGLRLIAPREQRGEATSLAYEMPAGERVLVDIHSHHEMRPYFSATDDRDDTGLSVSVVIGHIYSRPAIRCRLNVYGHRQEVPAHLIFDGLGPFRDAYQPATEDADAAAAD